ncbi:Uncharacterised protein [Vibrio cholerae]|uniref:Uncharacterized protein n=1 Tax=Vibrio cholerae TaxID=666 RepID=A0A655Q1Q5_VIBCL|nr:Uncharacterised protein [Vibrio cholerae]CSC77013.1 Uncharacterised protein [Vibrio cholerae]
MSASAGAVLATNSEILEKNRAHTLRSHEWSKKILRGDSAPPNVLKMATAAQRLRRPAINHSQVECAVAHPEP